MLTPMSPEDSAALDEIHDHLQKHGDGVKDVAFEVDDVRSIFSQAVQKGAKVVREPFELVDKDGKVICATIATYGETTHTLVQRNTYNGVFLPGYRPTVAADPIDAYLPKIELEAIDHCVGNQDWEGMHRWGLLPRSA